MPDHAPRARRQSPWIDHAAPILAHLEVLWRAHPPVGSEREIDAVILEAVGPAATRIWQHAASKVIAHFAGRSNDAPLHLTAHKDELGLIVKRVEPDGRLWVQPLGGLYPVKWGEGLVDVLTDGSDTVTGILSFGSLHGSDEPPVEKVKAGREAMVWRNAWVDCKRSRTNLASLGGHAGSKIEPARNREAPVVLGDYVCGHALDDKGGVAILIEVAARLADEPPQDIHLLISSLKETGSGSAIYATRIIPGDRSIAVEIVPAMPEYGLVNDDRPVIVYALSSNVSDELIANRAASLAHGLGIDVQGAVLATHGSDASMSKQAGASSSISLFGFPNENTHGYEIAHRGDIMYCLETVSATAYDER
jgi:putative aminopeptidase FrvX